MNYSSKPAFQEPIARAIRVRENKRVFEGSNLPLFSQKSPQTPNLGKVMPSQGKASSIEYVDKPTYEAAQDLQKLGYTQEMTRVCRFPLKPHQVLLAL